ncbi:DUF922 domain-containing protein [Notoacmeibacter sp. MSK16QG-6]|uniref:DUF922 domain-containing protein n=1 Tax=Notoacmeibacter sp. MSK16QG-6 TaxID=2957982 RepID=UPI0020A0A3E2|nr:DUF922 domain-containing protein [Notoacmeibacter sp. MSK16QG-6]MCP1199297.1 DUF922 domain-containing Zn-dependent protease [Notoacmeibacter sp. MSK16QG-6]
MLKNRLRLAGSLFALCLVVSGCTTTNVSTSYYEISGKSSEELDREIDRKGPKTHRGKAIATAAISMKPLALDLDRRGGRCSIRRAKFGIDANITLPRWREEALTKDRNLRRNWKGFAAYARAHEKAHVEIAKAFVRLLEKELEAIPPQPTCEALKAQSRKITKRLGRLHEKAQNAFDASEKKRIERLIAEAKRRKNS